MHRWTLLPLLLSGCAPGAPASLLPPGSDVAGGRASLVETTPSQILEGDGVGYWAGFGYAVAPGDYDGDGDLDVAVGAPFASTTYTGLVYLYEQTATGLDTTWSQRLIPDPGGSYGSSGSTLAQADYNGDGIDDLVVNGAGIGYVYYGSATGLPDDYDDLVDSPSGNFAASAPAGDVNADGYDDLLVRDDTAHSSRGLYVLPGGASGLSSTALSTYAHASTGESVGPSRGLGDVNHDGYDDVAVCYYTAASGRVEVVHGSATGLAASATTSISGYAIYGYPFGGDVNGDTYSDLIFVSPQDYKTYVYHGASTGVASTATTTIKHAKTTIYWDAGGVGDLNGDGYADWVYSIDGTLEVRYGTASGLPTTASTSWSSSTYGFGQGFALADLDGDGDDELAVGETGNTSGQGYVYLHAGGSGTVSSTPTTTLVGPELSAIGQDLITADVNGDGRDDLVAADYTGHQVLVYFGATGGLPDEADDVVSGSSGLGYAIAPAGDVNGDGYEDVLVSSGSSVVLHGGGATGLDDTASATLSGTVYTTDGMGGIGDVNKDGYGDVAIGNYTDTASRGLVSVYLGSTTGLSTTAAVTVKGTSAGDAFGRAVAGGDVNGDGYSDLIVGAPGRSSGTGAAYVYAGSATGVSSSVATTLTPTGSGTAFGRGIAVPGDLDGDGYDDVVIGASYASSYAGAVSTYRGSATGLSTTASATWTAPDAGVYAGTELGRAGDVNGDGVPDLLVGTSGASRIYVLPGSTTGYSSGTETTISGSGFAAAFAGGDVDQDGLSDVLVANASDFPSGAIYVYPGYGDNDGDGYAAGEDCDDDNADAHPGGTEVCDADDVDEDCDGVADADDADAIGAETFYADADGDGYGDAAITTTGCEAPAGYAADATDCDDGRADVHPGTSEVCDAYDTDEDCDGEVDDADSSTLASSRTVYYADTDGDGYGDPLSSTARCDAAAGYASTNTDCDDTDASAHPGGTELCDAADADEDCDGLADDADASVSGGTDWYLDGDGDGYGTSATTACDLPAGYAAESGDCDDADSAIHPDGTELCDAADADEDCDGLADDLDADPSGPSPWYADADGDGYGAADSAVDACDAPAGYVETSGDCDDTRSATNPAGAEVCDAANADEDCDSLADDADPSATGHTGWYADTDADGYGDAGAPTTACDAPDGAVSDARDCDDADASVHPGASETCEDTVDRNCDGSVGSADADADGVQACDDCDDADPDVADPVSWYTDGDGDGYGTGAAIEACDAGEGYADQRGDCDDADARYHPDADESDCDDPNDYNCDGSAGAEDADGDGYAACEECDDGTFARNPGAAEVCDATDLDEDCDGLADDADNAVDPGSLTYWYLDADGDGYGDVTALTGACDQPEGYVPDATDCDDADPSAFPGATEIAADGIDQDCDGADLAGEDSGDDTADDSGEGLGGGKDDVGCGCAGVGRGAGALPLALALLALARRRPRAAHP